MSYYKCQKCESEHSTENMVSYCASCYDVLRCQIALLKSEKEAMEKIALTALEYILKKSL